MPPKVPMIETGTTTAGTSAARTSPSAAKTTTVTSTTASSSVHLVSASDARIVRLRSETIVTLTSVGSEACSCGSSASTWSTVSMMFAPGCRCRITSTDGSPSARPSLRRSWTESSTSPTSLRRTAAPLR